MQIVNILISSVFQILLFSIIPFLWWTVTAKKKSPFFQWIGLKKLIVKDKKRYTLVFIVTTSLFLSLSFFLIPMFSKSAELATSQFAGQGITAFIPALIYAFLQTGLSEEMLFRGFLGKRFINKFGFVVGNTMQATLFGLLHGVMLFVAVGIVKAIVVTLFTGAIGWVMGYINEKQSYGSIVSSWCMHGISNIVSSIVTMFNLI